jgi:integrase
MRKRGERVLGPYEEHDDEHGVRYRVIEIDAKGKRSSSVFETQKGADLYKDKLLSDLARDDHTTKTALAEYKKYLVEKGNKPDSVRQTCWIIELFFPESILLALLTAKRCAGFYEDMRTRPTKRTKKPPSVDTHRSALAQVRTFLQWCIDQGWMKGENPLAEVKGVGKRRPRGKSLGQSGNELRVKETRLWYLKALDLADGGDEGAVAALVALLLGMRATEIVTRKVGDLDDDEAAGDLLWIPCSKTPAGRRTLEVPDVLRPLLVACAEGKTPDRYLFECEREQDPIGKPHRRDWIIDQVHRICDLVKVPQVTAHAMRGQLATLTRERGLAGHVVAATLGQEHEREHERAYARPGAAQTGVNRRGLVVLNGGVQVRKKQEG